jgi:DNA-binding Xre family transcriptional regulator
VDNVTNKEMLEKAIRDKGLKKTFLAEKIGLTPAGFYNCLNNRAEFRASQINTLCELLGIEDLQTKEAIFFAGGGV